MLLKKSWLLIIAFLFVSPAWSAGTAILATVGDDAITTQDLVARTRLIILSSGLKGDEDTARKIAPQILQNLINEHLQLQQAQKDKIDISEADINKVFADLERQNHMEPGQLKALLVKAHIPLATLQQQIKGQIAWSKIRSRDIQPKVTVTDEEVDDFLKAQSLHPVQVEYQVNEIVLAVDTPKDDAKAQALGLKLVGELNKGADFKKIARQFSQAASAPNGGEVGWLAQNQIPAELLTEIRQAGPHRIIGPIKSVEGYYILRVDAARDVDTASETQIVGLRHFEVPIDEKNAKSTIDKITSVNDPLRGCKDAKAYADLLGVTLQDYGNVEMKQLQPSVKKLVTGLPIGRYSEPVNTGASLVKFLVCSKTDSSKLPDNVQRDNVRETLFKRKVELQSRTFLRDLRSQTNIEIKAK